MSRIVVLCEGDTEEIAVREFISRQWRADGLERIGLHTRNLGGKIDRIGRFASLSLDEEDVIAVFTLVDLYRLADTQQRRNESLRERVNRAVEFLRTSSEHARSARFSPYLAVHETEAWIFAEGNALSRKLQDRNIRPNPQAEAMDFQKPPSARLNDLFLRKRGERYRKIIDGRWLFSSMAFQPVYETCRHFKTFYDQLREVARGHLTAR